MRTEPINDWDRRYMRWRDTHTDAYQLFVRFATEAVAKGKKIGIRLIVERVRWEAHYEWDEKDVFKFNDGFAAYLSRDLSEDVPGFLKIVRQKELWYLEAA